MRRIKLKQSQREYIVQVGRWVLVAVVACSFNRRTDLDREWRVRDLRRRPADYEPLKTRGPDRRCVGRSGRNATSVSGVAVRAAAGLGQAAADHVADGEQGDVEAGLVGEEDVAAAVGIADESGGEKHSDDGENVDDELGRLNRGLSLGAGAGPSGDGCVVELRGLAGRAVLVDKTTPERASAPPPNCSPATWSRPRSRSTPEPYGQPQS